MTSVTSILKRIQKNRARRIQKLTSYIRTLLIGQGAVVFVVGLPGSGKTFLSRSLANRPNAILFDDFDLSLGGRKELTDTVRCGKTCIVNHPMLRTEAKRREYENVVRTAGAKIIRWIYFENDPDACCVNNRRRSADGTYDKITPDAVIYKMSADYTIPSGSDVRPVWKEAE